jgi:hypothetical protein
VPLPRPGDAELRSRIIEELAKGLSYGVAAANSGISEATIFAWLKQGKIDIAAGEATPHAEFAEHIVRAHDVATGKLESKLFEVALEGKRPDITLAVLRVRKPDPWRDVVAIEADGESGDEAKTEAEIRQELARLRRITGSDRAGAARSARPRTRTRSGARSTGKPGESAGVQ